MVTKAFLQSIHATKVIHMLEHRTTSDHGFKSEKHKLPLNWLVSWSVAKEACFNTGQSSVKRHHFVQEVPLLWK